MPNLSSLKDPRSRLLAGLARTLEQTPLTGLYTGDIVREAGVSKRTFYEHFANKEECFLALYLENSGRILQVLKEATLQPDVPLLDRIERGARAYLTEMQRQAGLMKRLYIDILGLGAVGLQAKREIIEQFADLLIALYEAERAKMQGMPPMKPELLLGVIAGLNELILFKIEDGQAEQLLDLVETSQLMILGSLQGLMHKGGPGL